MYVSPFEVVLVLKLLTLSQVYQRLPAVCVSESSVVNVIAATMGKKISAPSHTISAR